MYSGQPGKSIIQLLMLCIFRGRFTLATSGWESQSDEPMQFAFALDTGRMRLDATTASDALVRAAYAPFVQAAGSSACDADSVVLSI